MTDAEFAEQSNDHSDEEVIERCTMYLCVRCMTLHPTPDCPNQSHEDRECPQCSTLYEELNDLRAEHAADQNESEGRRIKIMRLTNQVKCLRALLAEAWGLIDVDPKSDADLEYERDLNERISAELIGVRIGPETNAEDTL